MRLMHHRNPIPTLLVLVSASVASASQLPLAAALPHLGSADQGAYYRFPDSIRRVAVIGAGPNGLQAAATLVENGFEVRLFERADQPGGIWYYRDETPVPASFPNRPIENSSYIPDIPSRLPYAHIYTDGEGGISNDWRLREHERPSAIWRDLTSVAPPYIMTLPNVRYPEDVPWRMPNRYIQRHVRQYASLHGLNSNDEEHANVTSYSTRVERVHKPKGSNQWTLTLRKIQRIPYSDGKLRAEWWTEQFDAVIVATCSNTAAWVPDIPNLDKWANAYPERIFHSREYRTPSKFEGKNVLVVGGSVSAYGVATGLLHSASSVSVSVRDHPSNWTARPLGFSPDLLPSNVSIVPQIRRFPDVASSGKIKEVRELHLTLTNGSVVTGYDYIIFATGFRTSDPFLVDYFNSTIKGFDEPETEIAPIITDGTHDRSLHWTGHYIDDPTLAVMRLIPWRISPYQVLGLSRVWSGKARLPSRARMWNEYPGAGNELHGNHGREEQIARLFVTWLNNEALEFGGRLVDPLPRHYNGFVYFINKEVNATEFNTGELYDLENMPQSEWPSRNGRSRQPHHGEFLNAFGNSRVPLNDETWATWNPYW